MACGTCQAQLGGSDTSASREAAGEGRGPARGDWQDVACRSSLGVRGGGSDEARGGGSEGMQSDATRACCPTEAWRRRTKSYRQRCKARSEADFHQDQEDGRGAGKWPRGRRLEMLEGLPGDGRSTLNFGGFCGMEPSIWRPAAGNAGPGHDPQRAQSSELPVGQGSKRRVDQAGKVGAGSRKSSTKDTRYLGMWTNRCAHGARDASAPLVLGGERDGQNWIAWTESARGGGRQVPVGPGHWTAAGYGVGRGCSVLELGALAAGGQRRLHVSCHGKKGGQLAGKVDMVSLY
ncbi:hypothetical protein B0T18DRAFT_219927 [Schizothecium vesticola]|uniref:Uncharacterized protein n=1 Tax=Schizothecium vesticola TaxID=314040 RepID=A0AA40EKB2_9PEZI|nr:hypothetical protein B0T18DRAFT_219927 [Schizothecium vesticola]